MRTSYRWVLVLLGTLVVAGCGKTETPVKSSMGGPNSSADPHAAQASLKASAGAGLGTGPVLETMNAGGYTYVKINAKGRDVWAAGPDTPVKVGDLVSIPSGQPMQDFHSKTLNRTFETIYFVKEITPGSGTDHPHGRMGTAAAPQTAVDLSGLTKARDGQTIGEIFKNKTSLANREVLVRGKVVKFNAEILGRNWLHIQDGTGDAEGNDLTVTTQDSAAVGDTVLIRGTLATDKDFGAGYQYAVIVEKATVTKE